MIDAPPTVVGQLDAHMLASLRAIADSRTYPADSILTRQGETEHMLYVNEDGHVVVMRRLEDGTEQVLNTLGPRQAFGEMVLDDEQPTPRDYQDADRNWRAGDHR